MTTNALEPEQPEAPPVEAPAALPPKTPSAETGGEESEEPELTAAEREYRAALQAARALGLDQPPTSTVDREADAAAQAVARLGLDQPSPPPPPVVDLFAEPLPATPEKAEAAVEEEDEILGPEPTDGRAWYVLNTYSGHENRVKENLERRIASMDVVDRIFRVVVPTEEELEIRGGQRRQVQRKLLPGYVLVELVLDPDTWYVVRNTPGVTGFVGGERPSPLVRDEVRTILRKMRVMEPRVRVGFALGDTVRVTDGPFLDFLAHVDEINLDKGKVRVLISMFGRETPVELDFVQVEKV